MKNELNNQGSENSFEPANFVDGLFKNLENREADVLRRRIGLNSGKKETLATIGRIYGITRERARQIEKSGVNKLKSAKISDLFLIKSRIAQELEKLGGILTEERLLVNLLTDTDSDKINRLALSFVLENLIEDTIESVKNEINLNKSWKLSSCVLELVNQAVNHTVNLLTDRNKTFSDKELVDLFDKTFPSENETNPIINDHITIYLDVSKKIKRNVFGQWGLVDWSSVSPKKISDKIYLVLKDAGKPLHFREIAERINKYKFDKKVAYAPTAHNELILNDKYVLVGKGLYALKEWGYQPGAASDLLIGILRLSGEPMTKQELLNKVLEQRFIKSTTISLALNNKTKFEKLPDGRYTLISSKF